MDSKDTDAKRTHYSSLRLETAIAFPEDETGQTTDCTFYRPADQVERAIADTLANGQISHWYSADGQVMLGGTSEKRRVNIAKCFGGKLYALTVRRPGSNPPLAMSVTRLNCVGWDAQSKIATGEYLVGIGKVCEQLREKIMMPCNERPLAGLIVISGSTNVAKSQVVRGLIVELLCSQESLFSDRNRRHIVTLEDPFERHLFGEESGALSAEQLLEHIRTLQRAGIDYTPRQIGILKKKE